MANDARRMVLPRRRRTEIAMFLESFLASITFSIETISPNRREPIFLAEDDDGLDILFSSNHNIHKSLCGLCFWVSDPLIEGF